MPGFDPEKLRELPRRPKEVWQGGLVRLPSWVAEKNKQPFMPWAGAWVSAGSGLVHIGEAVAPAERSPEQALLAFAVFAEDPTTGGYLPGRVEVKDPGVAVALRPWLEPLGMAVVERERLPALEATLRDLARRLNGDAPIVPDPLSPAGASLARLASFAEGARLFHEAAPWRHLTTDDLIRIEAPPGPSEQRHALVLGRGGPSGENALWLFESAGFHERLLAADDAADVLDRETHDVVVFGPITEMPVEDAALFEDHGFAVAGPDAYPWAVRFRRGRHIERLSPRALAHAEAVLRALAETTEQELDTGRWTRLVPTPEGSVAVRLALPGVLDEAPPRGLDEAGNRGRAARPRPADSRANERTLAEIGRMLAKEKPASLDAAQALLDERFVGRNLDEIPSTASTPLELAQEICYEAFEAAGRRRMVLARRALAISPDCADAWTILAEHGGDAEDALRCRREAVAAAERALGPERLASDAPFWGDVRTRPFMRALDGLANACVERGLAAEAIGHYQRLLRLNPNDNQGVRDPLAGLLLATGDHAALETLVTAYDSDLETTLRHAHALLMYRKEGDTAASRKSLRRARRANRYVSEILLGRLEPHPLAPHYTLGGIDEARYAVVEIGEPWRDTPGAIDWLARRAGGQKRQGAGSGKRRGMGARAGKRARL